jgi:recombination protein RecT
MTPERLLRIALSECRRTPKLAECSQASLLSAIFSCAQLGLEPGGSLGHAYLVPYGRDVQFILGYRGMIDLARRSGMLESITAHAVFEGDEFECELGLEHNLRHRPDWENPNRSDASKLMFVYAVAKLKDGGHQFEVMSRLEVDQIKRRSKSGSSGPWVSDYVAMALKTVVRRLFKWLPVSIELAKAVGLDEAAEVGLHQDSDLDTVIGGPDEDNVVQVSVEETSASTSPLTETQVSQVSHAMAARLTELGRASFLARFGVDDLRELQAEQFDELMQMLADRSIVEALNSEAAA